MSNLDVFISGETVDLCIPTLEFAGSSKWYSWFNNSEVTRYLEQGMFPNTSDAQENFFINESSSRLILIISNKSEYLGVVSLSSINMSKKTCELAIVIDSSVDKRMSPYIALESVALITEHALTVMGINRISGGQHVNLSKWAQRMELLGYKIEGLHSSKFITGREISDTVTLAITYDNYMQVLSHRRLLWDSREQFKHRFKRLPKESFAYKLSAFYDKECEIYYNYILSL